MHPALAGLDEIPWAQLEHCYGSAADVPGLLRELTGSREQQERALFELHGNIWHQGTVYEATAHAVPFLARLALSEPLPLREELLSLLADIANGSSYLDVHGDLIRGGLSDEEREAMHRELAHVEAARAAVLDWVPRLVEKVMSDPAAAGLALVARLAAAFPDRGDEFAGALEWIWQNGDDLRVRAALAIALASRGEEHALADTVLSDLVDDLRARPAPFVPSPP